MSLVYVHFALHLPPPAEDKLGPGRTSTLRGADGASHAATQIALVMYSEATQPISGLFSRRRPDLVLVESPRP